MPKKELTIPINNKSLEIDEILDCFFENSSVPLSVTSISGHVYPNEAFCRLLGYSAEELTSKHWTEITYPGDIELTRTQIRKLLDNEAETVQFLKRYVKKDGMLVWAEMSTTLYRVQSFTDDFYLTTLIDATERMAYEQNLERIKTLLYTFIDSSQDMIFLKDENRRYIFGNRVLSEANDIPLKKLRGLTDESFLGKDAALNCKKTDLQALKNQKTIIAVEPIGDKYYETRKFPVPIGDGKIGVGAYIRDITDAYLNHEYISKISETNRIITECMIRPFRDIQEQLDFALNEAIEFTGSQYGYIYYYNEEAREFSLNSWSTDVMEHCGVVDRQSKYQLEKTGRWGDVVRQRKPIVDNDFQHSVSFPKGGPEGHVQIDKFMSIPLFDNNQIVAVAGLANKKSDYNESDLSAMTTLMSGVWLAVKRKEQQLANEYLAAHDYLTGSFNRRYFDETFREMDNGENFPLAIIMGDVNGLKLYNDSYGHIAGDAALRDVADRIQQSVGPEDVVSRLAGDEFAIIIKTTNEGSVRKKLDEISYKVNHILIENDNNALTISFGYGIQRRPEDSMDMLLKEAEAYMYNRKYYDRKSSRSNTVSAIMKTLFAKSEREEKHSKRVGVLTEALAEKLGLDDITVDMIRTAGFLHDIGKIGIDESILNKSGKLDKSEWEIMKLHSAKGADILERTVEYAEIANIVLAHHERFDGEGYPNGLSGTEIPLGSRIIAIADAYDAMTNERSYRQPMSRADAILELKKCAGKQHDPTIVSVFINDVVPLEDNQPRKDQ